MTSGKFVLLISIGLLIPQAMILLMTDSADGSIAMASIIGSFSDYRAVVPWFLVAAAGCAIAAILVPNYLSDRSRLILLLPQEFILFIYTAGALGSIMRESYADNVLRSWAFITTDQLFLIVVFAAHSMSIGTRQ